jgi:heptosyltransferase-3
MRADNDILSLLEAKGAQVARETQRAVILQPGALGDCILMLPLVKIMKEALGLGGADIIGHTEYIGIFPERSCVDGVRSMDSAELHRLFVEPSKFDLADRDPLINVFADYAWIVTFLGEPDSHFEQNLIFTANCSHSAEIITLSMKPPEGDTQHIAEFYIQQFARYSGLTSEQAKAPAEEILVSVTEGDRDGGIELLDQTGVDLSKKLVVIHPGSGSRNKCWHLENLLNLAKELLAKEFEVLFLLGPAELERLRPAEEAHIYGTAKCVAHLSLTQVVGLLSCSDAFIGNDSGVTHLAAGMGLRTFAMFGPTDPALYRPIGPALTVFRDMEGRFADRPSAELQKAVLDMLSSGAQ